MSETPNRARRSCALLEHYACAVSWLDRLSMVTIVIAMGTMAALVSAQVFMRYVLSSSIDSAPELSRLLFVWSIFLALPQGIPRGIHVGIDALTSRLPRALFVWVWRFTTLASLVLMAFLCRLSFDAVLDKWQEMMPSIEVTASLYYIPVLICAIHGSAHLLLLLWRNEPPKPLEIEP